MTAAAARIHTVEARQRLAARHEPYWTRLAQGAHLGFRKLTATSAGTWIAKWRDAESGERSKKSLGSFEALPPGQRYDAACTEARRWFEHLGLGGSAKPLTVAQACADYARHCREAGRPNTAKDHEARYKRWINETDFGQVELRKLTRKRVEDWRTALTQTPTRRGSTTRARSPASVNRDMASLRAALNYAHDLAQVTSDLAWRVALRPAKNADRPRDLYLDRDQRLKLIEAAPADLAAFLRGLCLVPLRPGALAALTCASFDKRRRTLTIGKDKGGHDRRIMLPAVSAAFFEAHCRDKLPTAPLLARSDGSPWNGKDSWKKKVKDAARAANLPEGTVAYALRHSTITDLVTLGLPLLTVAQLSGTSAAMIERHYGHLQADRAAEALAGLVL